MRKCSSHCVTLAGRFLAAGSIFCLQPIDAQEQAPAPVEKKGVRVTFLPPPLEGTLSLGVYTLEGKLVRVLASEATEEKFTIGLNGLITEWDGRDDAGNVLPAGKYFLRGFAVGDLAIEGVAFHGNDWMLDEESPHLRDLSALRLAGRDLLIAGVATDGAPILIRLDSATGRHSFARVAEDRPVPASPAANGDEGLTLRDWKIETIGEGAAARTVVTQRSGNEIVRALEIPQGDPQPISVVASADRDEIYLLERAPGLVRVRGLRLQETIEGESGKKVSQWEVFLSKNILQSDTFSEFAPRFRREPPFLPEEKINVRLVSNPLLQVEIASLPVAVAIDRTGSFLHSTDGLPLVQLATTAHLKWAVLGRGPGKRALTILQGDGAVVEEFRIGNPANIMAFDAGEYEWSGAVK